ncbi:MAG TPA: YbaK/EbsC family protein [Bacillota bacterium]
MPPGARRVRKALAEAGLGDGIRRHPEGTRTAADAARAIGCPVGAIVKSLVFMAGGEPLLVLTSGANRVDVDALAARLGRPVRRAAASEVREATGFAIGGVPPLGHPAPLVTLADPALMLYDVVWAAAGTPDTVFPAAPADLIRACGARQAPPEVFQPQP